MESNSKPAAAPGQAHLVLHRGTTTARHDGAVPAPFPLAADCIGRPLVPIRPDRIARAFGEDELEQLIRERLGRVEHVTIGEPINSNAPWLLMAALCAMPFVAGLVAWVAQ
jgi:hypothetical protein